MRGEGWVSSSMNEIEKGGCWVMLAKGRGDDFARLLIRNVDTPGLAVLHEECGRGQGLDTEIRSLEPPPIKVTRNSSLAKV